MTGKDMLEKIQQLDSELIEEAEYGSFRRKSVRKAIVFVLAAALVVGALTGAAVFTRWSNTMQFGNLGREQPSEQIKKQAEQTGLSVIPKDSAAGETGVISASDQGITVTLAQTVMDQRGGKVVFRIDGLELEEGQKPWAWWDYLVDDDRVGWSWGSQFYNGLVVDEEGNAVYAKNGEPIPRVGKNQELLLDYQDNNGSIEFSIDFAFPHDDGRYFGREMTVIFNGFGIQAERFEDEDIMTVPGKWELTWTLEGSTEQPMKWTPHSKIGHWGVTLEEVEIGQFSMKTTYSLDEEYKDDMDFLEKTNWSIGPAGVRLRDGTDLDVFGMTGSGDWDEENRLYINTDYSLNVILDPSQIAGMYFFDGYEPELDAQGRKVPKPYYYIPF